MGTCNNARLIAATVLTGWLSGSAMAHAPGRAAAIVGVATGGLGETTIATSTDGLSARLGRWDTPYPGGPGGEQVPGLETEGVNTLSLDIDVNDGGRISFDYSLRSWDSGRFDWLDIDLQTPDGTRALVAGLGTPGGGYGGYFEGDRIPMTVELSQWRGQRVRLVIQTHHDGWGDQTQGAIHNLAVRTCALAPLTEVDDADALRFEDAATVELDRLQPALRQALECTRQAVRAQRGALDVVAAYRPGAHQAHLREVWDKWRLLRDLRTGGCPATRGGVQAEFVRLGLRETERPAAANGPHSQGRALDLRSTLPQAQLTDLAAACKLVAPFSVSAPGHFVVDEEGQP